jgi:predicted acetyltransferase
MEERDRDRIVALHAEAFQVPEYRLARQRHLALERGWVITRGSAVVGGLRVDPLGQFFGGRSVPSAIITAVKLAPEVRGTGLGRVLMEAVVKALAERGIALSTLYPSAPGLYRRVGYEIAGCTVRYRASRSDLPQRLATPIRPLVPDDMDWVRDRYRGFAERQNGLVDRDETWWNEWVIDPYLDRPTQRFLLDGEEGLAGYLIYGQSPDPKSELPYVSAANCIDVVWHNPASARALAAFLGVQGPLVSSVSWAGPANDPLATILNARVGIGWSMHWMTRILSPAAALASRGYPRDVAESVTLSVVDASRTTPDVTITLETGHGTARVTDGGAAEAEIDVRGLAPLFTGWHRAGQVVEQGLLRGASDRLVARLDLIFGGPLPWMKEIV